MKTTNSHLTHVMAALGALALSMATATSIRAESGRALIIRAVVVHGSEVAITVANPTARTQIGTVTSRVPTNRGEIAVTAPVVAAAGQTVTVRVGLPLRAMDDLPLGVVVDDGAPF